MPETKKFSLETHLKRLRKIVEEMQSGKPDFDENIKLFQEGSVLIQEAKIFLDESEMLIRKLTAAGEESYAGELDEE